MADNHSFDIVSEINQAEMHNAVVQAQHEIAVRYYRERARANLVPFPSRRSPVSPRSDDARALLRQIFNNEVDLVPNSAASTLTVRLHHLAQAAHDQALAQLCATLNETETVFPGTNLTLIFEIGSSGIPPDQEV